MNKKILLLAILSSLVAGSCDLNNPGRNDASGGEEAPIATQPFVEQADKSFLFETNDPAYATGKGKTFFCYDEAVREAGAFDFSVTVKKTSGHENGGFGLVFQRTAANTFWVFNIDVRGYFYLAKVVNGTVTDVFDPPWKQSPDLRRGYGVENTLTVAFDGTTNYVVYGGGREIVSFSDTTYGATLRGGCFGIDAVVMPTEAFPKTPVSVRYTIVKPALQLVAPKTLASTMKSLGVR